MSRPPPGCPIRRVVMVSDASHLLLRGHGKHLKLECGHSQWEAGPLHPSQFRACLGGCYQYQRPMGRDC